MRWDLVLERRTKNKLPHDRTRKILRTIAHVASRNKKLGFEGKVGRLYEPEEIGDENSPERYRYLVRLRISESKAGTPELARQRYDHILKMIRRKATIYHWHVASDINLKQCQATAETPEECILAHKPVEAPQDFKPPVLTEELMTTVFGDIYGREAHLRLIDDTVQTFMETNGQIRSHTILYGLPGGCKSTLFERLKSLYEVNSKVERIVAIDATTMSKAGIEQWFLNEAESGTLPPVVLFEEIEKCNKDNLLALGSIMANGYIMRTNCRVGMAKQDVKCLIWATCNDLKAIEEFRNGFLFSRFSNPLECTLPDPETMKRILLDKIAKIPNGNPLWADKAMEFAKEMKVYDPRTIIGFLAGRKRLETGDFQRDKMTVKRAAEAEKSLIAHGV